MKSLPLLCALIVLSGSGCDGHLRSFRVGPAAQQVGNSQITAKDPLLAIRGIALSHGFNEDPLRESGVAAFSKRVSQQTSIHILVGREASGGFRVSIVDWPSLRRSAESAFLEQEIRRSL